VKAREETKLGCVRDGIAQKEDLPLFHPFLHFGHVRVVCTPGELLPHKTARIENQTLFVDQFVRIERISQYEL
jgi:hypothetical protein